MGSKEENKIDLPSAPTLSLCMIVKNEAHFIRRCLEAVCNWVDEMIIVDTGSSDETREIASQFNAKLYDFTWVDDFAAARNYSLEKACGDWILVLDADELIAEQDLARIRELIENPSHSAYFLQQYNYSNNPLKKGWVSISAESEYSGGYAGYNINPICRLFRNRKNIQYEGAIHEVVDRSLVAGEYSMLDVAIHHHQDSDPSKPERDRQLGYLRVLEASLEQSPNGRNYSYAGAICIHYKHDYAKAAEYFQRAVDMGHNVESNLEGVAEAAYRLGDYSRARTIYEKLYRQGCRSFTLCTHLANLKVKAGEFVAAIELLREALLMGCPDSEIENNIRHNISYLEKQARAF